MAKQNLKNFGQSGNSVKLDNFLSSTDVEELSESELKMVVGGKTEIGKTLLRTLETLIKEAEPTL